MGALHYHFARIVACRFIGEWRPEGLRYNLIIPKIPKIYKTNRSIKIRLVRRSHDCICLKERFFVFLPWVGYNLGMTDNEKVILDFIKKHTLSTYRKYKNLQDNPRVSFVIGWDDDISVQYEGIAVELKGEELKKYQNIHKSPVK